MALENMRTLLDAAREGGYAVGAFNIVDYATFRGVMEAAEEERSPVIIQTSASSTVKFYGYDALVGLARALAGNSPVPVALHLDHCKDMDMLKGTIDAGWTSVMIDASTYPFEENVAMTKTVVGWAHPKGVSVEGELGSIKGVEDEIKVEERDAVLADPQKAAEFVERTGIDALAPAIGTAHGLYKGTPDIDFERLKKIVSLVDVPVVIHGGTGLSDDTFRKLISLGAAKINISTQLKLAYMQAFEDFKKENPGKADPIKVQKAIVAAVKDVVKRFMRVFGSSGKA
ncbi:MAG: class II fructose-bisphosphate aldolase [Calditrichaeota bacterium]|nr:class II fructose-bisphosphate aldolase [Calditrichota bacterium]